MEAGLLGSSGRHAAPHAARQGRHVERQGRPRFGLCWTTARASSQHIDTRIDHPYAAYDRIQVNGVWKDTCDVAGRTLVRLEETLESIREIKELLTAMPEGPIQATITEPIPAAVRASPQWRRHEAR